MADASLSTPPVSMGKLLQAFDTAPGNLLKLYIQPSEFTPHLFSIYMTPGPTAASVVVLITLLIPVAATTARFRSMLTKQSLAGLPVSLFKAQHKASSLRHPRRQIRICHSLSI